MAVYCPIYDPATHSWYIIIHGLKGSYKKYITSPLYYYYSMGVKPPVGAKFTPEDYADFDFELEDSQYLSSSALAPLSFSSLPPISSLAAPISTNFSQTSPTYVSEMDPLSDLKNPLLMSNYGSSDYSSFLNPSTSSTASSPQLLSNEAAMLKNVVSLNEKLNAMESLLFPSLHADQSGSSLSLPTSPFISSLADTFATNTAEMNNSSSLKHPSTLSYLLTLPSTSSNLSYHLHSPPSTSSGYVNVPPINPQCPVHGAAATNSSNVKNYPLLSADYDESMASEMFLDDFDKTAMEEDDYDF